MNKINVNNKIKVLLHEKTGLDLADLVDDASLHNDLSIDSLDIIEIIHELEKTFRIKIDDDDAEKIVTVGDLCSLVLKVAA